MRLRLLLQATGGNTTGFEIPAGALAELGGGRPKVTATLNGHSWPTSVAGMGGSHWVGVSAAVRKTTGAVAGQEYDLELAPDTAPRTVELPIELAQALAADPIAQAAFDRLSYSRQRQHVESIAGAKAADTRTRRVARTVEAPKGT